MRLLISLLVLVACCAICAICESSWPQSHYIKVEACYPRYRLLFSGLSDNPSTALQELRERSKDGWDRREYFIRLMVDLVEEKKCVFRFTINQYLGLPHAVWGLENFLQRMKNEEDIENHEALYKYYKKYFRAAMIRCAETFVNNFEILMLDPWAEKAFDELIASSGNGNAEKDEELIEIARSIDFLDSAEMYAARMNKISEKFRHNYRLKSGYSFLQAMLGDYCDYLFGRHESTFNFYEVASILAPDKLPKKLPLKHIKWREYWRICARYNSDRDLAKANIEQALSTSSCASSWPISSYLRLSDSKEHYSEYELLKDVIETAHGEAELRMYQLIDYLKRKRDVELLGRDIENDDFLLMRIYKFLKFEELGTYSELRREIETIREQLKMLETKPPENFAKYLRELLPSLLKQELISKSFFEALKDLGDQEKDCTESSVDYYLNFARSVWGQEQFFRLLKEDPQGTYKFETSDKPEELEYIRRSLDEFYKFFKRDKLERRYLILLYYFRHIGTAKFVGCAKKIVDKFKTNHETDGQLAKPESDFDKLFVAIKSENFSDINDQKSKDSKLADIARSIDFLSDCGDEAQSSTEALNEAARKYTVQGRRELSESSLSLFLDNNCEPLLNLWRFEINLYMLAHNLAPAELPLDSAPRFKKLLEYRRICNRYLSDIEEARANIHKRLPVIRNTWVKVKNALHLNKRNTCLF